MKVAVLLSICVTVASCRTWSNSRLRDIGLTTSINQCMSSSSTSRRADPLYLLKGSTSQLLDADRLINHRMFWAEKTVACSVRVAVQQLASRMGPLVRAVPLPFRFATLPGQTSEVTELELRQVGPVIVDDVNVDLDTGLMSLELSVSGAVVGPASHRTPWGSAFARTPLAVSVRLPALQVRVTAMMTVETRPGGGAMLKTQELAMAVAMPEMPRVEATVATPLHAIMDVMLQNTFNNGITWADGMPLDNLSNCTRNRMNWVLELFDISFLQLDMMHRMLGVTETVEMAAGAVGVVKTA